MAGLTKEDLKSGLNDLRTELVGILKPLTLKAVSMNETLEEVAKEQKAQREALDSHTSTLDAIVKNTEHWKTESASTKARLDRHENWINKAAPKLGLKFSQDE